MINNKEI